LVEIGFFLYPDTKVLNCPKIAQKRPLSHTIRFGETNLC